MLSSGARLWEGRRRTGSGDKEKQGEEESPNQTSVISRLMSPHMALSQLVPSLSWCPVNFLKHRSLSCGFHYLQTTARLRVSKVFCALAFPILPRHLPKPSRFQVSAPAEAPGPQHLSAALLPSCSSGGSGLPSLQCELLSSSHYW